VDITMLHIHDCRIMQLWRSKMATTAATAATAASNMMAATVRSMCATMVLAPTTCMNRRSNSRCESIYLFANSGLLVQKQHLSDDAQQKFHVPKAEKQGYSDSP